MSYNAVFFGWSHPVPGREHLSEEHFQDFLQYLSELHKGGTIQFFEPILLEAHGGDLNGFFLIRGEPDKLSTMLKSDEWIKHQTRALMHLQGAGFVRGVAGELVQDRIKLWSSLIPS